MKSQYIEVRVMGKHELDWTTCYLFVKARTQGGCAGEGVQTLAKGR